MSHSQMTLICLSPPRNGPCPALRQGSLYRPPPWRACDAAVPGQKSLVGKVRIQNLCHPCFPSPSSHLQPAKNQRTRFN